MFNICQHSNVSALNALLCEYLKMFKWNNKKVLTDVCISTKEKKDFGVYEVHLNTEHLVVDEVSYPPPPLTHTHYVKHFGCLEKRYINAINYYLATDAGWAPASVACFSSCGHAYFYVQDRHTQNILICLCWHRQYNINLCVRLWMNFEWWFWTGLRTALAQVPHLERHKAEERKQGWRTKRRGEHQCIQ